MAKKNYTEAEMINDFRLICEDKTMTTLMTEWLNVTAPVLNIVEQTIFDTIYNECASNVRGWNEEELKMEFISPLLLITGLKTTDKYRVFYERILTATVENKPLSVKVDYMIATGRLDFFKNPYFYFQEYKPQRRPSGDSMGQLLQAMLIAQEQNNNDKPIYGCEIMGKDWNFVILEGKTYCISKSYDCTERDELLQIMAILRHFKHILETVLLVD